MLACEAKLLIIIFNYSQEATRPKSDLVKQLIYKQRLLLRYVKIRKLLSFSLPANPNPKPNPNFEPSSNSNVNFNPNSKSNPNRINNLNYKKSRLNEQMSVHFLLSCSFYGHFVT